MIRFNPERKQKRRGAIAQRGLRIDALRNLYIVAGLDCDFLSFCERFIEAVDGMAETSTLRRQVEVVRNRQREVLEVLEAAVTTGNPGMIERASRLLSSISTEFGGDVVLELRARIRQARRAVLEGQACRREKQLKC